jgi:hypothetical protein
MNYLENVLEFTKISILTIYINIHYILWYIVVYSGEDT